jgi:hypothetical protein
MILSMMEPLHLFLNQPNLSLWSRDWIVFDEEKVRELLCEEQMNVYIPVSPQPKTYFEEGIYWNFGPNNTSNNQGDFFIPIKQGYNTPNEIEDKIKKQLFKSCKINRKLRNSPYFWVKEHWSIIDHGFIVYKSSYPLKKDRIFDIKDILPKDKVYWRSPTEMKIDFSRITLKVINIDIKKLSNISKNEQEKVIENNELLLIEHSDPWLWCIDIIPFNKNILFFI